MNVHVDVHQLIEDKQSIRRRLTAVIPVRGLEIGASLCSSPQHGTTDYIRGSLISLCLRIEVNGKIFIFTTFFIVYFLCEKNNFSFLFETHPMIHFIIFTMHVQAVPKKCPPIQITHLLLNARCYTSGNLK